MLIEVDPSLAFGPWPNLHRCFGRRGQRSGSHNAEPSCTEAANLAGLNLVLGLLLARHNQNGPVTTGVPIRRGASSRRDLSN